MLLLSEDPNLSRDYYVEMKGLSKEHEIKFFNRKDFSVLKMENEDLIYKIAIGWRWLIKNNLNVIVLHDSLLPKYRGFAPLVAALLNQDSQAGVTVLFATEEYDTGHILAQKSFNITYPTTIAKLIKITEPLYFESSYSLWLDKMDYFIDWSWSATKIKGFLY